VKDDDLEAAYVNYVKAVSIVVEVIPRHRGMKEIDERKTIQAQEYWIFRKVDTFVMVLYSRTAHICGLWRGSKATNEATSSR
jgi:hypothetical protein